MSRSHLLLITPIQIQDMVDGWWWGVKEKKKSVQNTNRHKKKIYFVSKLYWNIHYIECVPIDEFLKHKKNYSIVCRLYGYSFQKWSLFVNNFDGWNNNFKILVFYENEKKSDNCVHQRVA